jgi:hypothetical protein
MDDYLAEGLDKLKATYPDVWSKLDLAADRLKTATGSEDYQAVGLICRDAMILFANAIFSPDFISESEDIPPEDKAMPRIETTLAHFGELAGAEAQRRLTRAALAYAIRLQHNQVATAEEARRMLLFTKIAITEVAALVERATENLDLVQRYGVYKCGGCGSTEVVEEHYADYEGPGPSFLICQNCNWMIEERRR